MLIVRPAAPSEVDALVLLVESAYRGDSSRAGWTTEADLLGGQRTDREAMVEALPDVLVAADPAGELVGCCVVQKKGAGGYFGTFAVNPRLQGAGTGSLLLTAAESMAADWGAPWMEMTVIAARPELIAYYERRGYVRTGATLPFPATDPRFGLPKVDDLSFVVLRKTL